MEHINDGRVQSDVRAEAEAADVPDDDGLDALTKDELRDRLPEGVEVPASATKAELLAALRG
jgi:hypothetical protein